MAIEVFKTLRNVDVREHTEQKQNLSYLSWAWAWNYTKSLFPDASYKIRRFGEFELPYQYDPVLGYMVSTEVTIGGDTLEMWLPVMDGANKAMKAQPYKYTVKRGQSTQEKTCDAASMFDINKTLMRCLVKNLAMFGLGINLYSGEDLPTDSDILKISAELKSKLSTVKKLSNTIVKNGYMDTPKMLSLIAKANDGFTDLEAITDIDVANGLIDDFNEIIAEHEEVPQINIEVK